MYKKKRKKRTDFEIEFYKRLLVHKPDFIPALIALGDAYTRKGMYEEGLEIDKKLSQLRPEDPIVFYNLACSYSLLGDTQQALKCLKKAIVLGYDDFHYMEKDKDLKNLRKTAEYKVLKEKLIRLRKNPNAGF